MTMRTTMQRFIVIAVIAAAAIGADSAVGYAGEGRASGERMLHRLDLNGDGSVTRIEAETMRNLRFLRLDADGDGAITQAEMLDKAQARLARRIAKAFARLDINGDGRIERTEFSERGMARFARLDADSDGRITGDEMRAQEHRGGHRGGHRWSHGGDDDLRHDD